MDYNLTCKRFSKKNMRRSYKKLSDKIRENILKRFGKLSEINLDPSSWKGLNFLTFDLDWACDEVIKFTVEKLIEKKNSSYYFRDPQF